jgi:diguanylate cyclase (GGDEF)-like protein
VDRVLRQTETAARALRTAAPPTFRTAPTVPEIRSTKLLDSVVDITAEADREHFRSSLSATVRQLLNIEDVSFLRPLSDAAGELVFQELHYDAARSRSGGSGLHAETRPRQLRAEQITAMLRMGYSLQSDDEQSTLLLPVLVREALTEVVVLRAPMISSEVVAMLRGFVRLYRNFVAVINEGERDALTGLLNRRVLETRLSEVARENATRHAVVQVREDGERRQIRDLTPHFIAVLDIDHFKRVNDTFGHLFGDEVILLVSQLMREEFRDDDMLFRYGGEEFVAILATHTRQGAMAALERFRARVAARRFPQLNQVTISAGLAEMRGRELAAAVIARADRALYCAKDDGRNRVYDYDELSAQGRFVDEKVGNEVELF